MIKLFRVYSTIIVVLLAIVALEAADRPTVDGVAGKLSCYCGTCPHLTVSMCNCSTADQIKSDIKTMIAQGMSEDDIIKSFVAQHGETVLAAPPKKGFQLTAWMVPFAAFLLGGVVLFAFLKRHQEKQEDQPPASKEPRDQEKNDHYRKLLDEELEKRK